MASFDEEQLTNMSLNLSKVPFADRLEAFRPIARLIGVQDAQSQTALFSQVVQRIPSPRYRHRTEHIHLHMLSCSLQARICAHERDFF